MDDDDAYDESSYCEYLEMINENRDRFQRDRIGNVKTLNCLAWINGHQMIPRVDNNSVLEWNFPEMNAALRRVG